MQVSPYLQRRVRALNEVLGAARSRSQSGRPPAGEAGAADRAADKQAADGAARARSGRGADKRRVG